MRDTDLFQLALGLTSPWKVMRTEFSVEEGRLDLHVDFPTGSRFACAECGGEGCAVHDTKTETWRHLDFFQHRAFLHARTPRVICPTCGVHKVAVPWARAGSGFTLLFEAYGLALEEGRVRYVTCCSTGDSIESWRGPRQQRDGGVLIDVEGDKIVAEGLSMPHSPRVAGDAIYLIESGRGALVRIDRATGWREDVTRCPGFARGLAFAGRYAVVTISLPRSASLEMFDLMQSLKARGASPWRGLLIVDLASGDIVEWLRIEGDVMELFDVAVVPEVRCPRGLGPGDREMGEVVRGD